MYLLVHWSTTSFSREKLATAWNQRHPCRFCKTSAFANSLLSSYTSVYNCSTTSFSTEKLASAQSTDILVRSEMTRREQKLTAGTVKMNLLVHFYLRVCCANTLLCSNTAIHGGSATLRINLCAARSSCTLSVSLLK